MAFLTEAANRGSVSTGYDVDNSLKLETDNTEYLHKTNSSSGDRRTFTLSAWIKRTEINRGSGGGDYIFSAGDGDYNQSDRTLLKFNHDDTIYWGGGGAYEIKTNRVFRDTYAWYHIAMIVDTTNSTAGDRLKLYVNGVRETDLATNTNPSQNFQYAFMKDDKQVVGYNHTDSSNPAAMYIAEVVWLDGTAASITDLGEFDEDSNIWKPVDPSGLTFGTNGCYLDFEDSSNLGNDKNGGTDFTEVNITAADQAQDSPTNNFSVLVPCYEATASSTLSEGSLKWDINMPSGSDFNHNTTAMSTFQMSGTNGGKWYIETKITNNNRAHAGIFSSLNFLQQTSDPTEYVYWDFYNGWIGSSLISTETNPPSIENNDIVGIAIDCDNQRVTFSKNGGWLVANGDMTGTSPSDWRWDWTSDSTFLDDPKCNGNVAFYCGIATSANVYRPIHLVNFGGYSPFTISSGNSDANGYGNFEYAVPSGFYALCTKNLAEYG